MSNFSITNTILTLRGNPITGFSNASDAILFDDTDLASTMDGADGGMTSSSTGEKGGTLTIKLLPDSLSVAFLQPLAEQQKNGNVITYWGTITNTNNNISAKMTDGVLIRYRPFPSLGKGAVGEMIYVFKFRVIASTYESLNVSFNASVSF